MVIYKPGERAGNPLGSEVLYTKIFLPWSSAVVPIKLVVLHSFPIHTPCLRVVLVVEYLTPEREVGVRYLPLPCCVLEQRHTFTPRNVLVIPQEAVAPSRHD